MNAPETHRLPELLLTRLRGQIKDSLQWWEGSSVDDLVRNEAGGHSISGLNEKLVGRTDLAHPSPEAPLVPRILLLMYGQLADDMRFLRRMVIHGRRNLLPLFTENPPSRGEGTPPPRQVDCSMGPQAPGLSCRYSARPALNWQHVFRSLFPEEHRRALEREQQTNAVQAPSYYIYQTRLTL